MKNENILELSRRFWDNYKIFLKRELTRKELEKCFEQPGDVVFYQMYCNHQFNVRPILEELSEKTIIHTLRKFLFVLREFTPSTRKKILKRMVNLCFDAADTEK